MSETTSKGHPKGLYVLFITEMWERFSYYGMRALFVLFMGKALLFDKALGSQIYGSYTGLVYLTPLIGGYMADRYWGNRKSIVIGGILMAVGQFFMFLAGTFYTSVGLASTLMFTGLAFLIFGNGFFKPNISTMVGQLYPKGDKRIDSAFTIFYMGINLGAFIAPILCGYLGETDDPGDFRWGFLAACIGMILSVVLFVWLKNKYIVTPEGEAIGDRPNNARPVMTDAEQALKKEFKPITFVIWGVVALVLFCFFMFGFDFSLFGAFLDAPMSFNNHIIGMDFDLVGSVIFSMAIAIPGLIISDPSLDKVEKQRIWVIYIACFFVIFFWSAFEQAGASLTYFAEEQTQRNVGWQISYPVVVVLLLAVIGYMLYLAYRIFKRMHGEQKGLKEIILFLLIAVAGISVYGIFATPSSGINFDVIPASFFQSINAVAIVIFAPIFAFLWVWLGRRNMEPASPFKQALGLFLLAVGYLVIAFGVKGLEPGVKTSMMWLVTLYTIHTFGELCLSPIGLSMVNKLAPVRLASLLMGVWFLANATANKFAGTLSGLYPETLVPTEVMADIKSTTALDLVKNNAKAEPYNGKNVYTMEMIDFGAIKKDSIYEGNIKGEVLRENIRVQVEKNSMIKEKEFAGFKINDLYSFFMIFVFMAGIASVILFAISSLLVKMMHGIR